MSKKNEPTPTAPSLPPGPVDFDALAKACAEGKSHEEAVELATKDNPVPEDVIETPVDEAPVEEVPTAPVSEAQE